MMGLSDDPALQLALPSKVFYIGALGSRRTHEKRLQRLREAAASLHEAWSSVVMSEMTRSEIIERVVIFGFVLFLPVVLRDLPVFREVMVHGLQAMNVPPSGKKSPQMPIYSSDLGQ